MALRATWLPGVLVLALAACEAGEVRFPGDDAGGDVKALDVVFGADHAVDAGRDEGGDATDEGLPADVPGNPDGTIDPGDPLTPDAGPDVPAPEETVTSESWSKIERFRTDSPGIVPDPYIDTIVHADGEIVAAFGDVQPSSDTWLLHSGNGWDAATGNVVVLFHGAGTDANASFASPDGATDAGLLKTLSGAGLRVFAVTFAHPFGSNDNQAVVVAEALRIVRARTGAAKAAVVAHSKSGLAVAAYLKGRMAKWGAPYAGDVSLAVFLGAPLGGMDWSFRHPGTNYSAEVFGLAMPTSWDEILEYGQWKDIAARSIYAPAYLGLQQSLRPWRETYPLYCETVLPMFCNAGEYQDWLTTYDGGKGFVSHSRGIVAAMSLGGDWMRALDELPAPADVAVAALAGTNSFFGLVDWEASGPADGMVFQQSALDLSTFEAAGATVAAKESFVRNHWELLSGADVLARVLALVK